MFFQTSTIGYYLTAALFASGANLDDPAGKFDPNPQFGWQQEREKNIGLHYTAETFPYHGLALAFHLARLSSILMGLGTVLLTAAIGWEVWPNRKSIGLLAAALVAFNPQFLFISSSVNNDNLLVLTAAGAIWQILRAIRRPEQVRLWFVIGLVLSAGMLAKLSIFVVALAAGFVLVANAIRLRSAKILLQGGALLGGTVLVTSGWWFWRNIHLYGDPLGWTVFSQVFAAVMRDTPLQWLDVQQFLQVQYRSFWGVFGWMNVPAPAWFYRLIGGSLVASLAGLGIILAKKHPGERSNSHKAMVILLAATAVAQELYMLWAIGRFDASWYQGWYLFPVISPLMLLVSVGFVELLDLLPERLSLAGQGILAVGLMGTAIFMGLGVIRPTYQMETPPKPTLWSVPRKLDVTFGQMISLKGYAVQSEPDGDQTTILLTLYWQAVERPDMDYSAFVHMVDSSGQILAQVDGAPGEKDGRPPSARLTEDIMMDDRTLILPTSDLGNTQLRVGLYNWMDGQRLGVSLAGEPAGDSVTLAFSSK